MNSLLGSYKVTLRYFIPVLAVLITPPAYAAGPLAAQVCSLLTSPTLVAVQATTGTGEGCAWQWPNGQVLSVFVHMDKQTETAEAMKEIMEANLKNPAFKRETFTVCTGGDMVVGDFRNGTGPGGVGYTQCAGFALTFSFQGANAQKHLPGVAKQLAGTTLAR